MEEDPMDFIPYPHSQLLSRGNNANYSLYFDKMTQWTWDNRKEKYSSSVEPLATKTNELFSAASSVLSNIHKRQSDLLLGQQQHSQGLIWEFRCTLEAPLVSGLGSGHPTETGMILDRNSGLPFIPASSVKGVLRLACALMLAKKFPDLVREHKGELEIEDSNPVLRRYFGDTDTKSVDAVRGQLVFLDVYPETIPELKLDIMNPHFTNYHKGSAPPIETESPNPVKFLSVVRETTFVFRGLVSPLAPSGIKSEINRPFTAEDEDNIRHMHHIACTEIGFGGKTGIGYGRFSPPVETAQEEWQRRLHDLEKETELKKYPWRKELKILDKITDWGSLKNQIMGNKALLKHKKQKEVGLAVAGAALKIAKSHKGKWTEERDTDMEAWLKSSGTSWVKQAAQAVENDPLTEKIMSFSKPADYDRSLDFSTLTQEQCALLNQRFRTWKWDNKKKAKQNNHALYKRLKQRIKDLKSN
jgi:CRISPR-associated protein Cmr6